MAKVKLDDDQVIGDIDYRFNRHIGPVSKHERTGQDFAHFYASTIQTSSFALVERQVKLGEDAA